MTSPQKSLNDLIYTEAELEKLTLDNSILNVFALCPRKFLYRKVLKLVPPYVSPALSFGTAFHAGAEAYYRGADSVSVLQAFATAASAENSTLANTRAQARERGLKEEYSIEFGLELMAKYMENYPLEKEPFRIMESADGEFLLEQGFALHLSNGTLIGKMDGITADGNLIEHKTTSRIDSSYLSQFAIHNQISLYLAALRDLLGKRPQRCLVNCVMVKDYKRPSEKKDEKLFQRVVVSKTDTQLDQTLRQYEFRINQIKNFLRIGFDAFYQNSPEACFHRYTTCEYFPLCLAQEQDIIEMLMYANYKQEEWTPYDLEGGKVSVEIKAREAE